MIDGLVVVDKPAGWTSHDVVARCRRIFGQKRVGHAGTLDPDATGVLLVGLGQVTRLLQFLSGMTKAYVGHVVLGVATSTLDASGEVTGSWDMSGTDLVAARAAAATLTGTFDQTPPMVSARKVGGRRLHELARAGIEVERPAHTVTVRRFELAPCTSPQALPGPLIAASGPVLTLYVDCSSGTYVRSLAADLGERLGGGAHLRALRRVRVGPFGLADAVALEQLGEGDVLAPRRAVGHLAAVRVSEEVAGWVRHGRVLGRERLFAGTGAEIVRTGEDTWDVARAHTRATSPMMPRGGDGDGRSGVAESGAAEGEPTGDGPWAVLDPGGTLLAVYRSNGPETAKPAVVLA